MHIIHTRPELAADTRMETLKRLHHTCVLEIAVDHESKRFALPKNSGVHTSI